MAPVTPRWEWRTFGASFDAAESLLTSALGQSRHSAETYLVSRHSEANTKIRDSLLDIKLLQHRDPHRLELWQPVLKAPFPLPPSALSIIFDAWSVPAPDESLPCSSPDAFVPAVTQRVPDVQAVRVTKARRGTEIDGCLVEIADLTFDGVPLKTVAIESVDPERLWMLVQRYGFERVENVNYVIALKRFLAGGLR